MLNLEKLRQDRADRGEDGFTLIELLVVVVIIGILIAIAIPLYLNYKKGANDKSAQSDLRGAISALEQCNSDAGNYPLGSGATTAMTVTSTAPAGCALTTSSGTTLTYYAPAAATAGGGYVIDATNSNGNSNKFFCYNSANGGSIKTVSALTATC